MSQVRTPKMRIPFKATVLVVAALAAYFLGPYLRTWLAQHFTPQTAQIIGNGVLFVWLIGVLTIAFSRWGDDA